MALLIGQHVRPKNRPERVGEVVGVTPSGRYRVRFTDGVVAQSIGRSELSLAGYAPAPKRDAAARAKAALRKRKRKMYQRDVLRAEFQKVHGRWPTEAELAPYL